MCRCARVACVCLTFFNHKNQLDRAQIPLIFRDFKTDHRRSNKSKLQNSPRSICEKVKILIKEVVKV